MSVDPYTVTLITAVVVVVCGGMFIAETFLRKDEGAGRMWAVGFLGAMLTVFAYLVWEVEARAWWTVAVGNAAFVGATAAMWLGCRRFNERRAGLDTAVAGVCTLATFVATALPGDAGGPWAGTGVMYPLIVVFAAAGAVETLRGQMAQNVNARGLAFVLGFEALIFLARTVMAYTLGPESKVFQVWVGTTVVNLTTITLMVVAVVTTSVLRADRAALRRLRRSRPGGRPGTGTDGDEFMTNLSAWVERAHRNKESIAVLAVKLDDLDVIASAFNPVEATRAADIMRTSVHRYAPAAALIGDDQEDCLLVATCVHGNAEPRRQGFALYNGAFEDFSKSGVLAQPSVGVGIATTASHGYDAAELVRVAQQAAREANSGPEMSVVMGEASPGDQAPADAAARSGSPS